MITDPEEIKDWLWEMGIYNYRIRPDEIVCSATNPEGLVVDVKDYVDLSGKSITQIPVQFGKVASYFDCSHTYLTSLEGAPLSVGGYFSCCGSYVRSLKGAPFCVGAHFNCNLTVVRSLSGIHKIIRQINGGFYCSTKATHILGLLLLSGVTNITIDVGGPIDKIMNKYIGTGDIISAQDELIDAGFKEQAKL